MNKNLLKIVISLTAVAVAVLIISTSLEAANIVYLKRYVETNTESVTLKTIARLDFDDKILKEKLEDLIVARVALPGQKRTIEAELVRLRMAQNNFPVQSIAFSNNEKTLVVRKSQSLNRGDIQRQVETYLKKKLPADIINPKFKLKFLPLKKNVPEGKISFRVLKPAITPKRWSSPFTMEVEVSVDNKPVNIIPVRVQINAYRKVLVAGTDIERTEKFGAENVKQKLVHIKTIPSGSLTEIKQIRGYRSKRVIPEGNVIIKAQMERIPVIKKGSHVRLEANIGGIAVRTHAEALTPGYYGDRVLVRNLDTKRIVQGTVISPGLVRIKAEKF